MVIKTQHQPGAGDLLRAHKAEFSPVDQLQVSVFEHSVCIDLAVEETETDRSLIIRMQTIPWIGLTLWDGQTFLKWPPLKEPFLPYRLYYADRAASAAYCWNRYILDLQVCEAIYHNDPIALVGNQG
jgi:hypothetical protein